VSEKLVGVVGEISTPVEIDLKSPHPVPPGTYVYIKFKVRDPTTGSEDVREVVGVVGSVMFKSYTPVIPYSSAMPESYISEFKRDCYMKVVIVADITGGRAEPPRYPPPPETPVYLAKPEHLKILYPYNVDTGVKIGYLLGYQELEVSVDINALAKHLLVVGTTGSGKSNFVAVLIDRVAKVGGAVVVFDVHGEYVDMQSESQTVHVIPYPATINLVKTPIDILTRFIVPEPAATKQRRLLRNALKLLNKDLEEIASKNRLPYSEAVKKLYIEKCFKPSTQKQEGELSTVEMYREILKIKITQVAGGGSARGGAVEQLLDKVDDFFEWHPTSLDNPNVSELVDCSNIVVVDVSLFTDAEKDFLLKVVTEDLLDSLKSRRIPPILLVVEESHLFIKSGTSTWSKESLQRFSREGRKFGGMLAIVSQRPRALDTDVVSQVQNFVLLKLVQKTDRIFITEVSDILSEEYINILPSLSPGQAVLLGEWIGRYPALIKIDLHKGKRVGATPNIVAEWRKRLEEKRSRGSSDTPYSEWM
jgi:DNA helicase HerA-like ATPase